MHEQQLNQYEVPLQISDDTKQVSVVIPTYNGAEFISKTLDSVIQQDGVKEIIVSDDCSQDETIAVVDTWSKRWQYPRQDYHVEG